ncbi:MAG: asparaginase [Planctomycetes bacterium]|nr:asparaginase [Planctomycetota bacterium]MCB9919886.1 asparaginase [Planctomycetota bacterium]
MHPTKKVYIAHTGGTIGMQPGKHGWAPQRGAIRKALDSAHFLHRPGLPDYDLEEFEPLLDSAEMVPDDWLRIGKRIEAKLPDYDGIVILHGTDTMAYTASALAFMLENLRRPVVLTGSQVPLCLPRNDAWLNVMTSMMIAANEPIPEVCVFFDDKLYRGCRTRKVDCDSFAAFASPNYPPLAEAGVSIEVDWKHVRIAPAGEHAIRLHERMDPNVGVLWLFPGIHEKFLRNFLRPPLKGAVIQSYGLGNGPTSSRGFTDALREATQRGVVLVNCTQCLAGRVSDDDYETGRGMAAAGMINGFDMTPEAALTKLSYLFGLGLSAERVRAEMQRDLRGELSSVPVKYANQ